MEWCSFEKKTLWRNYITFWDIFPFKVYSSDLAINLDEEYTWNNKNKSVIHYNYAQKMGG